ncbi:hypothetical protein NBRC110019_28140 [Neptunitalea chrysea]|uniref:Uncharacterized protein n=1 Tax=Neptunitalea chrysea TaxID=1647581 RepID=A0A9W6B9F7_9FLAO|nr:hypothetical protein [Neptunitalea chrysea]GLB53773.1 hypothetical protein NBRC110019_28140 [Neptunitalea chrysea]
MGNLNFVFYVLDSDKFLSCIKTSEKDLYNNCALINSTIYITEKHYNGRRLEDFTIIVAPGDSFCFIIQPSDMTKYGNLKFTSCKFGKDDSKQYFSELPEFTNGDPLAYLMFTVKKNITTDIPVFDFSFSVELTDEENSSYSYTIDPRIKIKQR